MIPAFHYASQLAPAGTSRAEEFRTALDDWLEKKSFQGAARVSNALTYVGVNLTTQSLA